MDEHQLELCRIGKDEAGARSDLRHDDDVVSEDFDRWVGFLTQCEDGNVQMSKGSGVARDVQLFMAWKAGRISRNR
jgi:hypothetical protein